MWKTPWKLGLAVTLMVLGGCLPESGGPRTRDVDPAAGAGGHAVSGGAMADSVAGGSTTLELRPPTVRMPRIPVGGSAERYVQIRNVGRSPLVLGDFEAELSADLTVYWFTSLDPDMDPRAGIENAAGRRINAFPRVIEIPSAEVLTLVISHHPSNGAEPTGYIHLETNDPRLGDNPDLGDENYADIDDDGVMELVIPIRRNDRVPELDLVPDTVNFGRVSVGVEVSETITAVNLGGQVLSLEEAYIEGAPNFRVEINGLDPTRNPSVLLDPDGDMVPGVSGDGQFEITVFYGSDSQSPDVGALHLINDGTVEDVVVDLMANPDAPCINIVPETLDFGAVPVGETRMGSLTIESCGVQRLRVDDISLTPEEAGFTAQALLPLPASLPGRDNAVEPPSFARLGVTLAFTPAEERVYAGALTVRSDDPDFPAVEVPLRGQGAGNQCPSAAVVQGAFDVEPLAVIALDGSPSRDADGTDGRPMRYEWVVVSRPDGSTAQPVERLSDSMRPGDGGLADDDETPGAVFFVDLAGEYVIDLRVTDASEAVAPSERCPQPPARVRITAVPTEDIHLQLVWNTPGDADQTDSMGADVDLHFMHPRGLEWFDRLHDCFFGNPSPDWGEAEVEDDDPSLDIDDTDGAGPENINLDNPQNTDALGSPYRVGVHLYRSTRGNFGGEEYGPSFATLRVYLEGELFFEAEGRLVDTNDFWEVGAIVWGAERRVAVRNRMSEVFPR